MESIKVKDVIKKLQELDDRDYKVYLDVKPTVDCLESVDGTGWETTKYTYTIILESDEIVRRYKNDCGVRKYINEEE